MTTNIRGNQLILPNKEDPSDPANLEAIEIWANTQVVNQVKGTGVTSQPLAIGTGAQGTGIVTIPASTGGNDFKLIQNSVFGNTTSITCSSADLNNYFGIYIIGMLQNNSGGTGVTFLRLTFTLSTGGGTLRQNNYNIAQQAGPPTGNVSLSGAASVNTFTASLGTIPGNGNINGYDNGPWPFDIIINRWPGNNFTGIFRGYNITNNSSQRVVVMDAFGLQDDFTAIQVSNNSSTAMNGQVTFMGMGHV
jgi:hypothetical protein